MMMDGMACRAREEERKRRMSSMVRCKRDRKRGFVSGEGRRRRRRRFGLGKKTRRVEEEESVYIT
jgi:hypothetical protein